MTPRERQVARAVFARAIELLRPAGAWTKVWAALTSRGKVCSPTDPDARCFCALGALLRAQVDVTGAEDQSLNWALRMRILDVVNVGGVADWNDDEERTKDEVIEAFRTARQEVYRRP